VRVIQLTVENIKRIMAARIAPDAQNPLVVLGGANGAGKSTALDCIWFALAGLSALPEEPLRQGTRQGRIELVLGKNTETELRIVRRFTEANSYLEVQDATGTTLKTPQAILDALYNHCSDDPAAILKLSEAEQLDLLLRLAGVDTRALDAEIASLTEQRRDAGRDAKRLQAALQQTPIVTEVSPVDTAALITTIQETNRITTERRDAEAYLAVKTRQVAELTDSEERIQENIEALKRQLEETRVKRVLLGQECEVLIRALPVVPDDSKERALLAQATTINQQAAKFRQRQELQAEAGTATKKHQELEVSLAKAIEKRAGLLSSVALPLPELTLSPEKRILYNGVPLAQCSQSEGLRAGIAIVLAQKPKLRICLIRNGSLLDDKAMAALPALAKEFDAQIWVERVGQDKFCQVIIEDGTVRAPTTTT
jgi:DNA repair exonuclease SbcCD ATPase subunit